MFCTGNRVSIIELVRAVVDQVSSSMRNAGKDHLRFPLLMFIIFAPFGEGDNVRLRHVDRYGFHGSKEPYLLNQVTLPSVLAQLLPYTEPTSKRGLSEECTKDEREKLQGGELVCIPVDCQEVYGADSVFDKNVRASS